MRKNKCGVTASDILKAAASQVDDIAKETELDEAGKMIVYRYIAKLLSDSLIHGVNIKDLFYMDSMSDYLDQQLALYSTANTDNVMQTCVMIHAYTAFELKQAKSKKF